ncbi:hypothetical protein C8A01DRAFT_14175 [Parachaetomium inaequale]|uniref:Uncharacterized protein n=1 Tax=Parachaetomium inaequale TaxID=2588326 RepID=A0AAN6PN26_9PEZI|nr:hypothetical protein C8A01DRAFT_14175 [Parachaetomium inaequale]
MPRKQKRRHTLPKQRRFPNRHDREGACRRIASHWTDDLIDDVRTFVLQASWDAQHIDDNDLVAYVKADILAGGSDLEHLVRPTIAVMAWTDGELPDSWHHALAQLPGPTELRLRAFFDDFETPQRSDI